MKQYIFEASKDFIALYNIYGLEGISDLDVGQECAEQNIFYRRLEAWYFDPDLNELEIFVED